MTVDRARKKAVRQRMDRTGEPYSVAARRLDTPTVTAELALDAIRDVQLPGPWGPALHRLYRAGQTTAGWQAALEELVAARPRHVTEGPSSHPSAHLAYFDAERVVHAKWQEAAWRYAHCAMAFLTALADAAPPPAQMWQDLPGERPDDVDGFPPPPEPDLPEALAGDPAAEPIRAALAVIAAAEHAAAEAYEISHPEDPDTGEAGYYVPEHAIDAVNEVETEADQWDRRVADFAHAVTHTLATAWLPRLAAIPATA